LFAGQAYGNAVGVTAAADLEDDVVVGVSSTTEDEVDRLVVDDGVTSVAAEAELESEPEPETVAELETEVELESESEPVSEVELEAEADIVSEYVVSMSIIVEDDIVELDAESVDWLFDSDEANSVEVSISIELLEDELVGNSPEDEPVELDMDDGVVVTTSAGADEDESPAEDETVELDTEDEVVVTTPGDADEEESVVATVEEEAELVVVVVIDDDGLDVADVVVVVIMDL
jgi:hypothetical protein